MTRMDTDVAPTPSMSAQDIKAFAEGAEALVIMMELAEDAEAIPHRDRTPQDREHSVRAEQAAYAIIRNAPEALRNITRLQNAAEDVVNRMRSRHDDIMTSLFGPDTEDAK